MNHGQDLVYHALRWIRTVFQTEHVDFGDHVMIVESIGQTKHTKDEDTFPTDNAGFK